MIKDQQSETDLTSLPSQAQVVIVGGGVIGCARLLFHHCLGDAPAIR
jgi:pyruvate/2-oxoglutarate dehydrogenase complex dihydrolipoamide dehydrogenase (E3) component